MPTRKTKNTTKSKAAKAAKPARRAKKQAPARKPKAPKPAAKRPARSKAKPAKRPAPPEAEESQEQTEPLLLEPIPDDAVVKHVVPLLGLDGLVQLMASAKTMHTRLGDTGTPEGKAALRVVAQAYGVAMPSNADILDWGKRLFRWTRHQRVSDELDLDIAKAFGCSAVRQGCKDEAFPRPRPRMRSIVLALAESATWLVCRKKFAPRDEDDEDIVFKDLRVGDALPESLGEVVQGVHSRVRLNERVTADLEVEVNYGDEGGGATFYSSLRVEIRGGRPSKGSQRAEGLAHWSGWDDRDEYGEVLWDSRSGYGDAGGDPPDGREIREGCAERLIAALGMSPRTVGGSACYKHLMGVLLYILAAPFRWEWGTYAVGPPLEHNDEANTMLEVIRHQVLLACDWEEGDEDGWDDDDERYSSYGRPPRPLRRYRLPAAEHRTGLWWLGKDPPSEDDFEPPPHSGGGSSDDDDDDDGDY